MAKLSKVLIAMVVISMLIVSSGCNNKTNPASQNKNPSNQSNAQVTSLVKSKESVNLDTLKYDEIATPKDYPSVAGIAVSGDTLFFCSGSDKPSKNTAPCLTYIEKVFSYNLKTKELKTVATVDRGFVQIDWVNADNDWVVYREIRDEYGGPVRIYAINRKSNAKKLVYEEKGCTNCKGVTSSHTFNLNLWKDFLIMPQVSFDATKKNKSGEVEDGIFHNSIKLLNLKTGKTKVIFSKASPLSLSGAIFSASVNSSYLIFNYAEGGKQSIYVYSFDSGSLKDILDVPLRKGASGDNNYIADRVLLTEDDFAIFDYPVSLQKNTFLKVIAPIGNIKQMKSLPIKAPYYYLTFPQTESRDYIVWANRNNDTLYILNRNSGCLKTIELGVGYMWIEKDKLFLESGKSFIVMDLKKNGF